MPHGLPAFLFHSNLYIKKATSNKIIKKFLTFLFFKKEKERIKLILFLLSLFFFGKNMKNLETSNPSVPLAFKDSKHLQQTQSPYTIKISHSHYKPKFTVLSHSTFSLQTQIYPK